VQRLHLGRAKFEKRALRVGRIPWTGLPGPSKGLWIEGRTGRMIRIVDGDKFHAPEERRGKMTVDKNSCCIFKKKLYWNSKSSA
jgi:hypothetical protein